MSETYIFGDRTLVKPLRPLIMGIVNINDDSFSGDGSLDVQELTLQIRHKVAQGADFIDLGAESARTNREAVSVDEEVRRLFSVLEGWEKIIQQTKPKDSVQVWPPVLSINTWRVEVLQALMDSPYRESIGLVNDMSALADSRTLKLVAASNASLLIMHSVGLPKQDHSHVTWDDICASVSSFFEQALHQAHAAGVPKERIILDPGLDFAKQTDDSLKLIQSAQLFASYGTGVLMPLSRKNFIGETLGREDPLHRDAGTLACVPFLTQLPCCIVRAHNVEAIWQGLRVLG